MSSLYAKDKLLNARKRFPNVIERKYFKGIKDLFKLVEKKADELGMHSALLLTILETLLIETGRVVERRLPATVLHERLMAEKISQEEYDAQVPDAIHKPCAEGHYPFVPTHHPLIRPAMAAKDIILKALRELEVEK